MYKTILVPLDGSERAEKILPHVEALAKHSGSKIVLLRVIEAANNVPFMLKATPDTWRNMVRVWNETAENYLSNQRDHLAEQGIEVTLRVEYGPVAATIITVAEEEGADLIGMTSHGATGLARVFYGSVASGVLQRVNRPLLLIRGK